MKALNWIAWISGGIGIVLMLLAGISELIGHSILLGINVLINYFIVANSFFLITIALFVFIYRCQCKKD